MMEIQDRGFEDAGDQAVCLECVLDDGLRHGVSEILTEHRCTFCERESNGQQPIAADFEEFMPLVMAAIRFFYDRSEESLFWSDDFTTRYSSEDVAYDVCGNAVTDRVIESIVALIPDEDWNPDPGRLRPDLALKGSWEEFRNKVKYSSRFTFLSLPEESSDHPDEFTTTEFLEKLMKIIEQRQAVLQIPAGQVFYRGRLIDRPDDLSWCNAHTLGPPPPELASANRMSPAGIPMFYGSDDPETVVAEIGAHGASRFAVIGAFETTRALRMINLADLPPVPSVFDAAGRESYYDLVFLHSFTQDLRAPVSLNGSQHIDYVPTQVVTEYMKWLSEPSFDGILFSSAQNEGRSCVVFCGPEHCADAGEEDTNTILRLREGSVEAVRVVAVPVALDVALGSSGLVFGDPFRG
ncbi:HEPN-associated N-terminal domain-containing protein [Nocardiopsis changdeensis]|uniref:RES domain-containing protein n=1 Tax=Nocardiopsis changdeensis TaxID=2831969 RepID=A0ABX8BJQ6_9ACTN|nr:MULTISPECIES: HEPN-associated N-terminal domain-containing protein [Nocardiopsis]QUX22475.1 RES domain-containing protein [Nocardiopsis changdeensis]QYX38417.1 RES domain-containing protein [Nocardiopsis sp. MT53]